MGTTVSEKPTLDLEATARSESLINEDVKVLGTGEVVNASGHAQELERNFVSIRPHLRWTIFLMYD